MTAVFKVVELFNHGWIVSYVTENGKILESSTHYESGLNSNYIADSCVDVGDNWIDCNSSVQDLYWWFEEDLGKYTIDSVEEVEYQRNFQEPVPTKGKIGDRKIVTPMELKNMM